jgi:DNA-binding IscR family transcriptional regulator
MEYSTLKALYELGAFSQAKVKTSVEIARHAGGVNGNPDSYKKAAGRLKRRGLTDSAISSGGGYWLTLCGQRVAKGLFGDKA